MGEGTGGLEAGEMSSAAVGSVLNESELERRYRSASMPPVGEVLSEEAFEQQFASKPQAAPPVGTVIPDAEFEEQEAFVARPSDRPQYLAMPRETQISALPKPGLVGRVKESVLGGVRTGETLLGQVMKVLSGEKPLMAVESAPAIRPEAMIVEPQSAAGSVARGALKGIGEFTTPESALLLTGVGGAITGIGRLGLPFLKRAISAGFAADMIHSLYQREPEFRAAADAGDENRVWELMGELLPTGAMAAGAALHATRPGTRLQPAAADRPIPDAPTRRALAAPAPEAVAEPPRIAPEQPPATRRRIRPPVVPPRPVIEEPAQPLPSLPPIAGPAGRETALHSPAGENRAQYRVVEAETLQPSHDPFTFGKNSIYPEGVQERQYHSNRNAQAEVVRMGQEIKPELLVNSDPTAVNGPPQATPQGIVLGGNARSMAVKRAYQSGQGEKYRQYLTEHAAEFGIPAEQLAQMKSPVLVREILDSPRDVEGLRRLGQGLNRSFTKALTEVEQAVSAGKNLTRDSAERISVELDRLGESGSLRTLMESKPQVFRDTLLRDGVLRESDLPRYFTEQGTLNVAGKDFVENTLLGAVVRDADLLQSLPKSLTGKLERVIPQLIELGQRSDDWNIVPAVRDAAREIASAQARGISVEDHLGQRGLFGEGPAPDVEAIARVLAKKPTEAAALIRRFASEARSDIPGQQGMFGPVDPTEAFSRIFEAPQPAGAGSYGFFGRRPTLPSIAQQGSPELVRKSDILRTLSRRLSNVPIRVGRFFDRALGIYKVGPEAIRLKQALDIPVASHESGHHIHKMLWGTGKSGNLNWRPLAPFRAELKAIATKPKAGQSPLPEGFAEFIRLYLTKPGEAQQKAPRFHKFFEGELAREPELRETLLDTRKQIQRYVAQPAAAKVLAHISKQESPAPSNRFERLYTAAVDALTPIKRVVEGISKRSGTKPPTEENAYELARLLAGWTGKADHFLKRGTFDPVTLDVTGKPLQQILRPVEGSLDDLRIYLVARRAIEKGRQGKDTGIVLADAREALRQTETPVLKRVAEELYDYNDQLLQYLVKSDYLNADQYAKIKALNQDYVPFFRVMEEQAPGPKAKAGGKSVADLWQPVKRMKGSGREIIDPLESIVKNTYTFINLAERNRVGQALVRQARTSEGAGQWIEEIPVPKQATKFQLAEIQRALEESGADLTDADLSTLAMIFRPTTFTPRSENILTVFENGRHNFYQVNPDLYQSMKALDREGSHLLIRLLSMPARALRLGATGLGPEFVIRNPIRDTWTAFIQSRSGFKPGVDTFRGLFHALKRDGLYQEWQRAGGEHAALVALDRTNLQKNLKDLLASPMKSVVRHPIEALRMVSEFGEAATRLGEYGRARQRGATPRAAALASREVTLDFARQGARTQAVNSIVAFWNATIQGTDKFARAHMENPKGTVAKAVAGVTLPSLLLYTVNRDDPDYQELPRWQKDFFWNVPTQGTPLQDETPFVPIPKPFLWGMFYGTAAERAMEWVDERDPAAFDGLLNSFGQTAAPSMIPTAAVPVIEWYANRSLFTDRPLVPGYLERLPAQYQAEPWTTEVSKRLSSMFLRAGIPVPPIKLDQAIFGYTGGAGRAATQALNPLLRTGPEPPSPTMADIPGLRAFAVRFPSGQAESVRKLYDRLNELEEKSSAQRFARRYPGRIEPERLSGSEGSELRLFRLASRRLQSINAEIRRVTTSNMAPDAKRQRIDGLYRQMIEHSKTALGVAERIRMRGEKQ